MSPAWEKLQKGVLTASAEETRSIAAELAQTLPPDSTVALYGDLGVGKTTFVQGLASGLGIGGSITSPTYTVYTIHRGPRAMLVHLDAYRVENAGQFEALLLDDFLTSPFCLAIEWPDRIAAAIPKDAVRLEIGIAADQRHSLRLRSP